MNLINSVNLIISLKNQILTTNKVEKNNDSIQKINTCQYYRNISLQYFQNISTILFVNKVKIKWEKDKYIENKYINNMILKKIR